MMLSKNNHFPFAEGWITFEVTDRSRDWRQASDADVLRSILQEWEHSQEVNDFEIGQCKRNRNSFKITYRRKKLNGFNLMST